MQSVSNCKLCKLLYILIKAARIEGRAEVGSDKCCEGSEEVIISAFVCEEVYSLYYWTHSLHGIQTDEKDYLETEVILGLSKAEGEGRNKRYEH